MIPVYRHDSKLIPTISPFQLRRFRFESTPVPVWCQHTLLNGTSTELVDIIVDLWVWRRRLGTGRRARFSAGSDRWGYAEGIIDSTTEGPAFGWACTSQSWVSNLARWTAVDGTADGTKEG